MNYYNPYFYTMPTTLRSPKAGLFTRLFGGNGITLGGIINGTQRALNFANQAIPLVKQVRPMIGNAKTMFKVMNEFKRSENPKQSNIQNKSIINNKTSSDIPQNEIKDSQNNYNNTNDGPTFFI